MEDERRKSLDNEAGSEWLVVGIKNLIVSKSLLQLSDKVKYFLMRTNPN
jgi:hypothetical protein